MHAGRCWKWKPGLRGRRWGELVGFEFLSLHISFYYEKKETERGRGRLSEGGGSESSSINLFVCQVPGVIIVFQAHNLNHKKLLETGTGSKGGVAGGRCCCCCCCCVWHSRTCLGTATDTHTQRESHIVHYMAY